jgi:hypothetical protein
MTEDEWHVYFETCFHQCRDLCEIPCQGRQQLESIASLVINVCEYSAIKCVFRGWSDADVIRIYKLVFQRVWDVQELAMYSFFNRTREEREYVIYIALTFARDVFESEQQFTGWTEGDEIPIVIL